MILQRGRRGSEELSWEHGLLVLMARPLPGASEEELVRACQLFKEGLSLVAGRSQSVALSRLLKMWPRGEFL